MSELVVGGIPLSTDFAFAPDGRVFIAGKGGTVRIVKNGTLLPTLFIELSVNDLVTRGLLGLALDPSFETNGYVYLYYTYENNAADPFGPKTGQLIRVTANGDVALPGSEVVLLGSVVGDPLQPSCEDFPLGSDCLPADGLDHFGGTLRFASDGKLFVSTGDAQFLAAPEELMLRSQELDSLAGKMLRLQPDGSAPGDNPFFTGNPADNRSKVWAYGLRNPFRFGLQPGTDLPFIGDVGSAFWEEVDVGYAGTNFGWPCYEGAAQNPVHSAFTFCQDLYASGSAVAHPLYSYATSPSAAVIGGVFSQGLSYPAEFQNAFFFGDFVRGSISVLKVDASNNLLPDSVQTVLTDAGQPVDFEVGPGGDIHYLTLDAMTGASELRRIRFVPGNRPPVAQASATPMGGLVPLNVEFTSEGSSDPDGQSIAFAWDFGDDASSSDANPNHTFTQFGAYLVTLTVSDSEGAIASDTVSVLVGNLPPRATITVPPVSAQYNAGDVIAFAGFGTDAEDGTIAPFNLRWRILLHHCEPQSAVCHTHPFLEESGDGASVVAPNQGDEIMYLEVRLTVIDSVGLTDTVSVTISDARDMDADGCTDGAEVFPKAEATRGGGRDPLYFWDFMDQWTEDPPVRDRVISVGDIGAVVARFTTESLPVPPKEELVAQALTPPTDTTSYHSSSDRGGADPAGNPWDLFPPDGVISVGDIGAVVAQFTHNCSPPPPP